LIARGEAAVDNRRFPALSISLGRQATIAADFRQVFEIASIVAFSARPKIIFS